MMTFSFSSVIAVSLLPIAFEAPGYAQQGIPGTLVPAQASAEAETKQEATGSAVVTDKIQERSNLAQLQKSMEELSKLTAQVFKPLKLQ